MKAVEGDGEMGNEVRKHGSNSGIRARLPRFKSMLNPYEQLGTVHVTSFMFHFLDQSTGRHKVWGGAWNT